MKRKARFGTGLQIGVAVVLGAGVGFALGNRASALGEIGILLIRILKTLATPLVFFTVVNAIASSRIQMRSGVRLLLISGVNAAVAGLIALGVVGVFSKAGWGTGIDLSRLGEWMYPAMSESSSAN